VRKRQLNDITRIDIPKDTLDAHRLAGGQRRQVLNCIKGFAELFKWIGSQSTTLIVFEATGPYHRQLEQALGIKGIQFVKVNPQSARVDLPKPVGILQRQTVLIAGFRRGWAQPCT
jgi:transposase